MRTLKFLILFAAFLSLLNSQILAADSHARFRTSGEGALEFKWPERTPGPFGNPYLYSGQLKTLSMGFPYVPVLPISWASIVAQSRKKMPIGPEKPLSPPVTGLAGSLGTLIALPLPAPVQPTSMPESKTKDEELKPVAEADLPTVCSSHDFHYMKPIDRAKENKRRKVEKSLLAESKAVFRISLTSLGHLKKNPRFRKIFEGQLTRIDRSRPIKLFRYFQDLKSFLEVLTLMPERSLEKLTLHGGWVTDSVLNALSTNINKTDLEYLDLSYCPHITDAGLIPLAFYLEKLQYLNLNFCVLITDHFLLRLNVHSLRYLELEGCNNITDLGLSHFANFASELRTLNISGCERITDVSFSAVASAFKMILNIHLKKCIKITPNGLFSAVKPYLKNLTNLEPPIVDEE